MIETWITGVWPAEQKIEYATLLYHKIKNDDEERKIKKMMEEQEKKKELEHFLQKCTADSRNLGDWNRQINRQEKINMEKWRD